MPEYLINDSIKSKEIARQIDNAEVFQTCWALSQKYWDVVYPSCNEIIKKRLFTLCHENGIIHEGNAQLYCSLVEQADIRVRLFQNIFCNFDGKALVVYVRMTEGQKKSFIKQEAHKFLLTIETSFCSAKAHYKSLSNQLPEYKEQITDIFYNYCYEKGVLDEYNASSFIETVGKRNPRARHLLNKYSRHCIIYLLISLVMCIGGALLAFYRLVPGWTIFILGPIILGGFSMGIQYVFKTISALCNYVKTNNFSFDTTTMAYHKVHGTAGGYYKPVDNPLKEKEEVVHDDDGLDRVEFD